jgi:hypothetical protein
MALRSVQNFSELMPLAFAAQMHVGSCHVHAPRPDQILSSWDEDFSAAGAAPALIFAVNSAV